MESKMDDLKASKDEMTAKSLRFSDSDDEYPEIACETCRKIFSSVQGYEQHLRSKKHYQMQNKVKLLHELGNDALKKNSLSSDSVDVFFCDVCGKEMSDYTTYLAHVRGGVHAKNLLKQKKKTEIKGMKEFLEEDLAETGEDDILHKSFALCAICNKTFEGPESYQQHMEGVNHKKKLQHQKVIESLKKKGDSEDGIENDANFSKCKVCSKSFSGPIPYQIHLNSSVHEKALKQLEAEEELKEYFQKDTKLVCKECKKTFSDPLSLKSHLANNNHGKQKVKEEMFGFVSSNPEIVAVHNLFLDKDKDNFQNGQYFLVCKLCHMSFTGPESAQDHLLSKKHLKIKQEKIEKKILKEKLKDKQNGHKLVIQNDYDSTVSGKLKQESSTNDEKIVSAANGKQLSESSIQDEFEII